MTSCASSIGVHLNIHIYIHTKIYVLVKNNYAIYQYMTHLTLISLGQQSANVALTQVPPSWMNERRKELLEKRDFAYDMIMSIPG